MKCQSYKLDIQPFLSVSQVFVLCIVHNVPLPFVSILLYGFLYIVVCIQNIFDIVPFPHQSFPVVWLFYILSISYLYLHSLKYCGAISLNRFLGLKNLNHNIFCLDIMNELFYAFQLPVPSHQFSITQICVKQGFSVSFISFIAIYKRVRLRIIPANSPSRLSSLPQSMMTF